MEGDEQICNAAGMTGYLRKPLDLNRVKEALAGVPNRSGVPALCIPDGS
jgi:CheY-like chemotaxis protein